MSRSGYTDEESEPGQFAMWRGQVASAMRGKRGQRFLRDLVDALDALPERRLITGALQEALVVERGPSEHRWTPGPVITIEHCAAATYQAGTEPRVSVCAIGAVGIKRGVDMSWHDPERAQDDPSFVNDRIANDFDIADQLAAEVQYENDECGSGRRVPLPNINRRTEYDWLPETPEQRWVRMRAWAVRHLSDGALSRQGKPLDAVPRSGGTNP